MKQVLYKILFPFVNKKYNLEGKWWHRLLKVIFTFLIIVTFIISLFFYYGTNEKNNFFKGKSSGFSLIPTANADNNTNFIDELNYDIKNGATREEIKQAYPELSGYNGITQSEAPQEQGFFKKIIIAILLSIISTYILNLLLQIIYYKIILYVIYGKNLNSSATTKN